MKKQWISVKCGLSRDPKHRRQMGKSVWTFLHMLDLADWETGIVYDWKDENAAEDMGIDIRVLREDRRKLDDEGYITCKQKQYGQDIYIHNWTNPREYSGEVRNQKQEGGKKSPPSDFQGDSQGYAQGSIKDVTPTSTSNIKEQNGFSLPAKQEPDKVAEWLKMGQFAGAKRETRIDAILSYLGETFHINTEVKNWKKFAKFAETRQTHHGEKIEVFIAWLYSQKDFNLQYWPPTRMEEFWPMAFVNGGVSQSSNFRSERLEREI